MYEMRVHYNKAWLCKLEVNVVTSLRAALSTIQAKCYNACCFYKLQATRFMHRTNGYFLAIQVASAWGHSALLFSRSFSCSQYCSLSKDVLYVCLAFLDHQVARIEVATLPCKDSNRCFGSAVGICCSDFLVLFIVHKSTAASIFFPPAPSLCSTK